MPGWRIMLGGLLVWAAHFLAIYILASVFESSTIARIGTGIATLAAVAANIGLVVVARRAEMPDAFARWMVSLGMLGVGLSLVAVLWQGLPALIG